MTHGMVVSSTYQQAAARLAKDSHKTNRSCIEGTVIIDSLPEACLVGHMLCTSTDRSQELKNGISLLDKRQPCAVDTVVVQL